MSDVIGDVSLPGIKKFGSGKVREIFDLDIYFLIVATDRISAYDYILPTLIPQKGKILNKLSVFWFKQTKNIMENHFITDNVVTHIGQTALMLWCSCYHDIRYNTYIAMSEKEVRRLARRLHLAG